MLNWISITKSKIQTWIHHQLYWGGSYQWGVWTIRVRTYSIQLKAPWNEPLFSERYRKKKAIIPLGKGWRILIDRRKRC